MIKNDADRNKLVKFLVQAINTVDGRRDTAQFYIDAAVHYEIERREKRLNRKIQKMRDAIVLADDEEFDSSLDYKFLGEEEKQEIREYYTREIHR